MGGECANPLSQRNLSYNFRMLVKKLVKILTALFTTVLLSVSVIAPVHSATPLELLPGGVASQGYLGIDFSQRQPGYGENVSIITTNVPPKAGTPPSMYLCSALSDINCSKGSYIRAQLILPPCITADQMMCIESLNLGTTAANMQSAVLDHEIKSLTTPADTTLGMPKGGGPSLWNAPKTPNKAGTTTYGVIARVVYNQDRGEIGAAGKSNAPLTLVSMSLSVIPVSIKVGKYYPLESYETVNLDGSATYGIRPSGKDYDNLEDCAWSEAGFCAKYEDFSDNTRVGLGLRMGAEMTGWLYGRMKDVDVKVNPIDAKYNLIRIEAAPIDAPGAFGFLKKSELSTNPKMDARISLSLGEFGYSKMVKDAGSVVYGYDPVGNFEDFAIFEPILKTKPDYRRQWVIFSGASVNGYQATSGNKCFDDKTQLLGIVTTNALVYSPSAPEFKDGALDYKVAGLHFLEDGKTLTRGSYDLAIRTSVARCVYGFTDAPFQASVSVINADGNQQVIGTETVREDAKREWLFLTAKNFTFSSPTIRVKLTQEKKEVPAVPAPVATQAAPTPAPTPATKAATKTITCVKGKVIKKVSAKSPKCPAGYKEKS